MLQQFTAGRGPNATLRGGASGRRASPPITQGRLNKGQGRDRRGIRPQDARTQSEPDRAGAIEQHRPLLGRKAAFRPDQQGNRPFGTASDRAGQGRERI